MIWKEALPDVGPCLFPYRRGCWRVVNFSPFSDDPDADIPDHIEWWPYILGVIQIEVALAFVNHEARRAALDWVRRNKLKMRLPVGQEYPVAIRDDRCDVVFVSDGEWDQFLDEPTQYLSKLAVTQRILERDWSDLGDHVLMSQLGELLILNVDDSWAESLRTICWSGPTHQWCEFEIDYPSPVSYWTNSEGWTVFSYLDINDADSVNTFLYKPDEYNLTFDTFAHLRPTVDGADPEGLKWLERIDVRHAVVIVK
ncbi:hypothetical protein B0T16DRAFT_455897 [Cercophora newfieldiana]|uniref:Uncharacterized protein n=1 Tax=Cercophora newfieldiana TaxID=92897 RepID=A0AA39Y9A3_9PEZI|nr:hypothetical protein B0T16DRAFT_455897 [Cercophora newfieldiana]